MEIKIGTQKNNPLHGVRLDYILEVLVAHFGWSGLGKIVRVNCFNNNPTMKSSLKFLRQTPWAREKVEELYLELAEREGLLG
ncbi:VF530 family protein [Marinilongibacter aquaticus]|uniref:VF530 family protein n=1 Tax=Marinilongibacter aquaticus TaxID=2975157 RepID=UPI0021BDB63F|nr:VF530 family protein [Marinilongibacter aquaticus]UBM58540.1 VF530 family protein [Marinilongibacter aquaticus]